MFATHYHELTKLKKTFPSIENYHVTCKKSSDGILFLHKVQKGVAAGSFGIEVAKLAALPDVIISRAKNILQGVAPQGAEPLQGVEPLQEVEPLDNVEHAEPLDNIIPEADGFNAQSEIDSLRKELEEKRRLLRLLESVTLDDLSPREAFDIVWKLKSNL